LTYCEAAKNKAGTSLSNPLQSPLLGTPPFSRNTPRKSGASLTTSQSPLRISLRQNRPLLPTPRPLQERAHMPRPRTQMLRSDVSNSTIVPSTHVPSDFLSRVTTNSRPPSSNSLHQIQSLYNLTFILATAQSLLRSPLLNN
jgi:hypothetical protein